MNKFILFLFVSLFSTFGMASEKCPSDQVKGVQVKSNGDLIYTTKSGVRRLASTGLSPSTTQLALMTLMASIEKGFYVQAAYPDGYNCGASNTDIPAEWIYTQNP